MSYSGKIINLLPCTGSVKPDLAVCWSLQPITAKTYMKAIVIVLTNFIMFTFEAPS